MSQERLITISRHLTSSMADRPPITAHILDTSRGVPAENVQLKLSQSIDGSWVHLVDSITDKNGRCNQLQINKPLESGIFKMKFDTASYFKRIGTVSFYPYVEVVFEIKAPNEHYHIPLLISPYSYTTYRGS